MTAAIEIDGFSKRFGSKVAVKDLDLEVAEGSVCGFLGVNGAGKTTTIRCLLDLLRPTSGRLRILGRDCVRDSVEIRRRVGYLPEEPEYYGWMTVDQIVRFNSRFFPTWDEALANDLRRRLDLPGKRKLEALSRGMRAKVGLLMALAQRPEILILDDPTSGLDAVVRREFLEAMIATVQSEGGTVFFSTHLIHELERVADEVAILHEGSLRVHGSLEAIKQRHKQLRVVHDAGESPDLDLPGMTCLERHPSHTLLRSERFEPSLVGALLDRGATSVDVIDLDLEEIFVDAVRRDVGPAAVTAA